MGKEKLLQVRIDDEFQEEMKATVEELKEKGYQPDCTVAKLVRQAVEKWINFYRRIEAGKTLVVLETGGANKNDIIEFQKALVKVAEDTQNEKVKEICEKLEGELDFKVYDLATKDREEKEKAISRLEKLIK